MKHDQNERFNWGDKLLHVPVQENICKFEEASKLLLRTN